MSQFPALRMRRLRRHDWTRKLVAENTLSASDFIWPIFVSDGERKRTPVASMPGVDRLSVDLVAGAAEEAAKLGIPVIALFPYTDPSLKTADGKVLSGTWQATPGTYHATYSDYEFVHMIAGRIIITPDGGQPVEVGPGDAFVVEADFRGTWKIVEPVTKHFVVTVG